MNMQTQPYQDQASSLSTKLGKDAEIDVILKSTRRLQMANQNRNSNFSEFAAAVQVNRKLWTILASDVATSGNRLPPDLRAMIFYLSEFVQYYSSTLLKDEVEITPLLDINVAIIRGLSAQGVQE